MDGAASTTRCASRSAWSGCISPWNLPLYLLHLEDRAGARDRQHRRRQAVRDHAVHGRAARASSRSRPGFPPGVLNIVHGHGPERRRGARRAPDVKAISFTGGTRTGAAIARAGRAAVQEAVARARRQEPERRVRRRRSRATRVGHRGARGVLEPGRRSACAARASSCERSIYERFRERVRRARARAARRRSGASRRPIGRARLAARTSRRCMATSRWRATKAARVLLRRRARATSRAAARTAGSSSRP